MSSLVENLPGPVTVSVADALDLSPPPPAVILPTIWRYLQILEAPPYFLGLGLSAFSLSGLLTGPLFGFWSDRSGTTKSIVLFSNLFEIAGELSEHGHMTAARVNHVTTM